MKTIIVIMAMLSMVGCGLNTQKFNDNISKNKFIGIENTKELKKMDKDLIDGLCDGLVESQMDSKAKDRHELILNKALICKINQVNKRGN
jgi:hypothetical protein